MSALRGQRQRDSARRQTRAMWQMAVEAQARRQAAPTSKPKRSDGCENASDGPWFQVGGEWEDHEDGENCGECEWCEEYDD